MNLYKYSENCCNKFCNNESGDTLFYKDRVYDVCVVCYELYMSLYRGDGNGNKNLLNMGYCKKCGEYTSLKSDGKCISWTGICFLYLNPTKQRILS